MKHSRFGITEGIYLNAQLHLSIRKGNLQMVEELLNKGADIHSEDIYSKHNLRLDPCENAGDNFYLFGDGKKPLHVAAYKGNIEILKFLLDKNADIRARNDYGETALHVACEMRQLKVVEMLLQYGADVNAKDKDHKTPLHCACSGGCPQIVKVLLSNGADLNETSSELMTPLHFAAEGGNADAAEILLQHGANVDVKDEDGLTPFHLACRYSSRNTVEVLLKNGANVNVKCNDNKTGLSYAFQEGCAPILEVLIDNGADTSTVSHLELEANRGLLSYKDRDYSLCCDIIEKETIKQHIANLFSNKGKLVSFHVTGELKDFTFNCEAEIEKMLQVVIHNGITFYDILMRCESQVAIYAKNKVIIEAIECGKLKEMFPIYARMIEKKFSKGKKRLDLLRPGCKSLNSLLGHCLPELIVDEILKYLNDADLKNLTAAGTEMINL